MARAKSKRPDGSVPVDATKHAGDTRTNIPTAELESFAEDDEREPTTLLYPRDPSLDPQLVWKGKDGQDRSDLQVPAVPVYIQETIEPRALIEDLRGRSNRERADEQASFFDSFEGMELAERVDFYQHQGKWANRMILGDSLLVMASLAEKEGLKSLVQMIYVDPPYGIKFGSNWQVSTRKRDVRDGKAEDATRQPEQIRAFRDTWELGIHSYLSYMRDRLRVARDLLTESGSIFVQIGDENVHLVRNLLDEVFGSENFVSQIAVTKSGGGLESVSRVPARLDYLLWYAVSFGAMKYRPLFEERIDLESAGFTNVMLPSGETRSLTREERRSGPPPGARVFRTESLTKPGPGSRYTIEWKGRSYSAGNRWWGNPKDTLEKLLAIGRVRPFGNTLRYIRFVDDFSTNRLSNLWDGLGGASDPIFVVQTNTKIVERCMLLTTDPGDLVLDPTSGSGTTAYVAERWGRRWMAIDTSRVALALARTRLMTARYPFYLLADSQQGQLKEAELSGQAPPSPLPPAQGDIKKGFVYERVPHVTLKSIANNPDIRGGLNGEEIDAAIARHAEMETLYDRPLIDPKVVRVSGPFTVESLSPHRVLSPPHRDVPDREPMLDVDATRFVEHVLDNLRSAGVQNTVKAERLQFNRLEPWPGVYIQASGDYTENDATRTVAVCIGPEHGTVDRQIVDAAAKEAVRFADLLVVCGFAFDAYASETTHIGNLTILQAKMNPDLQMPDLLKKTGAGNLFMVFGEPDIDIRTGDDTLTVEIRGLDVYDPTTGVIRSHSTDDIACWFIDTNYNGESFVVRHAYFLGGDDPYESLRKTLRTEIDEATWSSLYSATSHPFPRPTTGKIAVKIINHYGDEVLTVHNV